MPRGTEQQRNQQHLEVGLGDFIRAHRDEILSDWESVVRREPIAEPLDRPALLDHVPELLLHIADMADALARGSQPQLPNDVAQLHAVERLEEGFDLAQVVGEFSALRECIFMHGQHTLVGPEHARELSVVNQAIDKAISVSVERFTRARDRTLVALDRIANEALESRTLDELLEKLLQVFVDTTAAVDTAAILIREGDDLVVRACRGLDNALGFRLHIGEGFAGRIAAERRPLGLGSASENPIIKNAALRASGVRTLYGVPLMEGEHVIGVAHMGSLTAFDFSVQDKRLFNAMSNRASGAIHQQMLRERADRAAAELAAVIESIPAAIYIGTDERVTRANRAGLELLGYADQAQLVEQPIVSLAKELAMRDPLTRRPLAIEEGPLHTVARGRAQERDVLVRSKKTREDLVVHSIAAPIQCDGKTIGAVAVAVDVTARRQIEAALRDRELEFRTLAEHIPQFAWITDRTGSTYWYNQRWFDYTGTRLEDVRGWGWHRVHHPDHLHRVVDRLRHAFETGEPWEDVFPLRGKDGRYRWFLSRAVPVRDDRGEIVKWFGTNTDITEQRFLSNATSLLATTLDVKETLTQVARLAVPDFADWCVVDVINGGGLERVAIIHSDPAKVARVEAWSRQSPTTERPGISDVINTGTPIFVPELTDQVIAERLGAGEHLSLARELGVVSLLIVPLTARGRTLGTITLVHAESGRHYSTTERDVAMELGRRAGIAIDNARLYAEAQDAVHAREEMIAIVSHDLRNPLGVIDLGATMALASGDLGVRATKHVETIQRSARRMERLLGDLLDTASLQVGRLTLQQKREEVSTIVSDALDGHEQVAAKKGIRIMRDCELDGAFVRCDRERLIQALGNLLGNAIKFCAAGDVIHVRGKFDVTEINISVTDTGPGIPSNELPHIFEPYWSAKRHARKGTGLGLYICKGIIEAHGGSIAVDTKLGEGTTFTLTLPIAQEDAQ